MKGVMPKLHESTLARCARRLETWTTNVYNIIDIIIFYFQKIYSNQSRKLLWLFVFFIDTFKNFNVSGFEPVPLGNRLSSSSNPTTLNFRYVSEKSIILS